MRRYIYKLLVTSNRKYRVGFFLPWIGISIGVCMLLLIDGIMSGMEDEIFNSLDRMEKEYYIENFSDSTINDIINYLDSKNIDSELISIRDVIISNGDSYMLVNMIATSKDSISENIVIGAGISYNLNISEKDSVSILSPLDISFSTLRVPIITYFVDSIYTTPVVGFDDKYIFTASSSIEGIINGNKKITINQKLSDLELEDISNKFRDITISHWKDSYLELVSAIKLEKFLYAIFAYMLILISCLGSFTITNFIITNKLKEISILNILGLEFINIKKSISSIMLSFTLFSTVMGFLYLYLMIHFGITDFLISVLFPDNLFYNFTIRINAQYLVIVLLLNIITVYFSSIIAVNVIGKNRPIDIIKGNLK